MDLYSTTDNGDGTFTFVYTDIFTDINGVQFTAIVQTQTISQVDLNNQIQDIQNRINDWTRALQNTQSQVDAANAAVKQTSPPIIQPPQSLI